MKDTIKLAVVLSLYTVVACFSLAMVHSFTEPIIQKTKEENSKKALQSIFSQADSFESITEQLDAIESKVAIQAAHVAKKGDDVIGLTIQAAGPTYSKATILMGITLEKKLTGLKFLELLDTPSLGSKAAEEPFAGQFKDKNIKDAFSVGDDIVSISGATITSKGVSNIVKTATALIDKYMDEKLKNIGSEKEDSGEGEDALQDENTETGTEEQALAEEDVSNNEEKGGTE